MAKPVVDGIERSADLPVVRLNTSGRVARVLAQGYSLRGVPTLLVLDGEGREVLRQVVDTPRRFAFVGADNGSISTVVSVAGRWLIRGFNDTSHL